MATYPTPVPTPTKSPVQQISFQQQKAMQNYFAPQSTPNNFYYSGTNPDTKARVSQMNQTGFYIPPTKTTQNSTTTGMVLGNNTQVPTSTNSTPTQEVQVDPYSGVYSSLDQLINWLPEEQNRLGTTIDDIARAQSQEVQTAKEGEMSKFPVYQEQIRANKATSLRDMASNIRNAMSATASLLGARGAGDSSATQMASYALSKEAGKNRTSIENQVNQMNNDLRLKETDINTAFEQQLNQINTWKATQLAQIANDFSNKAYSLRAMKPELQKQTVDYWLQQLQSIEGQARQYDQAVRQWASQRLSQINDYKMKLGQLGQYSPQQIVSNEIQPLTQQNFSTGSDQFYNPLLLSKRKQLLGY